MKRHGLALSATVTALALAIPAQAQMNMPPGMHMPDMKMPAPKKKATPAKKKAAPTKRASAKKASGSKAPANKPAAKKKAPARKPHAGHDMSSMPGVTMPPGQTMENMPGMATPSNTDTEAAGTNLPAGNAAAPPVPTDHAADGVYGTKAMKMGRHHLQQFHGGQKLFQVLNNLTEYQARKGRGGYEWNSEAWYGGDMNRLWLKSEGDGTFGRSVDRAEVQALYSHAIGPYFNVQGGLRYDFKPNPSRVYATVGVEGLAPSFFELEGALFLSNKGEVIARAEGYYDQRITQRLILQPRAELNFAAQNSRQIGVGAGLSDAEIGVRLRYDIRREFSPYVGVQYQHAFGRTRRYLHDAGEDAGGLEVVAGVRTWF
jgi:copper resistance protein B